jgi:hypothetical protein
VNFGSPAAERQPRMDARARCSAEALRVLGVSRVECGQQRVEGIKLLARRACRGLRGGRDRLDGAGRFGSVPD